MGEMDKKQQQKAVSEAKKAGTEVKRGVRHALAIGCYNSTTDDEIGRSKEHAKHMRRTRRRNFATKMSLIDPHYGKKAAGVLAAGTVLGLAATTVPTVGVALGPTVGGAVIASGLAYIETDAHRKVGDHAILDSLLEDRGDNVRTNTSLVGYNGRGDYGSPADQFEIEEWTDSDDEEYADLLPPSLGGRAIYEQQDALNMDGEESVPSRTKNTNSDLMASLSALSLSDDENSPEFDPFASLSSTGSNPSASQPAAQTSTAPVANTSSNSFFDDVFGDSQPSSTPTAQNSAPNLIKPSATAVPPSYAGSGGRPNIQRFTNPHASPALQMMNNAPSSSSPTQSFDSPKPVPKQASDDDFFAMMMETPALQPQPISSPNSSFGSANSGSMNLFGDSPSPAPAPQPSSSNDFFGQQKTVQQPEEPFFPSIASHIQGGPEQQKQPEHEVDPFADLFSRPSGNQGSNSNYSALHSFQF